jgi:predicted RNA-binding protein Jag
MKNIIEDLSKKFFEKLWVEISEIEAVSEQEKIFLLKIKSTDSNILIWPHWKNLEAIQSVLKMMCSNKIWERIKIHLEINDYIHNKDERLFQIISEKIKILKSSQNESLKLPTLNPYERKKVHSFVMDLKDDSIYTKSEWEWKNRRIFLYKMAKKLTIDIDWDDI